MSTSSSGIQVSCGGSFDDEDTVIKTADEMVIAYDTWCLQYRNYDRKNILILTTAPITAQSRVQRSTDSHTLIITSCGFMGAPDLPPYIRVEHLANTSVFKPIFGEFDEVYLNINTAELAFLPTWNTILGLCKEGGEISLYNDSWTRYPAHHLTSAPALEYDASSYILASAEAQGRLTWEKIIFPLTRHLEGRVTNPSAYHNGKMFIKQTQDLFRQPFPSYPSYIQAGKKFTYTKVTNWESDTPDKAQGQMFRYDEHRQKNWERAWRSGRGGVEHCVEADGSFKKCALLCGQMQSGLAALYPGCFLPIGHHGRPQDPTVPHMPGINVDVLIPDVLDEGKSNIAPLFGEFDVVIIERPGSEIQGNGNQMRTLLQLTKKLLSPKGIGMALWVETAWNESRDKFVQDYFDVRWVSNYGLNVTPMRYGSRNPVTIRILKQKDKHSPLMSTSTPSSSTSSSSTFTTTSSSTIPRASTTLVDVPSFHSSSPTIANTSGIHPPLGLNIPRAASTSSDASASLRHLPPATLVGTANTSSVSTFHVNAPPAAPLPSPSDDDDDDDDYDDDDYDDDDDDDDYDDYDDDDDDDDYDDDDDDYAYDDDDGVKRRNTRHMESAPLAPRTSMSSAALTSLVNVPPPAPPVPLPPPGRLQREDPRVNLIRALIEQGIRPNVADIVADMMQGHEDDLFAALELAWLISANSS